MKKRFITIRDLPKKYLSNGEKACRWCGGKLKNQQFTWCSNKCNIEFLVRFSGSIVRHAIFNRDKGVCANCGLDTERINYILKELSIIPKLSDNWELTSGNTPPTIQIKAFATQLLKDMLIELQFKGFNVDLKCLTWKHLWEADHILEVVNGGGACGLENLQTLCTSCHKAETKKLRSELKKRKKDNG